MRKYNFNLEENEEMFEENYAMTNGFDIKKYMDVISKIPVLTREEEIALAKKIKRGDLDARNKFIEHNLRLVVNIAKDYSGRGIDMEELVQEGNLGLFKAVDKFDYTLEKKFSTYATYWIKKYISKYIRENSRTIRISSGMIDKISELNHAETELEEILGRRPAESEIAKKLGKSIDVVRRIRKNRQDTISLDMPVGEECDDTLKDVYEDRTVEGVENMVMKSFYKQDLNKAFEDLNERENKVLTLLFGIDSDKPMSIDEVAKKFCLNREGVHSIAIKAMRKIKTRLGDDYMVA